MFSSSEVSLVEEYTFDQRFHVIWCHGSHAHAESITDILPHMVIMQANESLILWVQISDLLHCSGSFFPDAMIDLGSDYRPQDQSRECAIGHHISGIRHIWLLIMDSCVGNFAEQAHDPELFQISIQNLVTPRLQIPWRLQRASLVQG